jgi:hypothetical protein
MPISLGKAPPRRLLCKRRPSKTTSHSETNQPQCASRSRDRGALFVIGCCGGAPKKLVRQHLGLRAALLPLFGGSPAAGHWLGVSHHRTATALAKLFGLMPVSSTDRQQGWLGKAAAGLPQSKEPVAHRPSGAGVAIWASASAVPRGQSPTGIAVAAGDEAGWQCQFRGEVPRIVGCHWRSPEGVEARARIELAHTGFANQCITTLLPRQKVRPVY